MAFAALIFIITPYVTAYFYYMGIEYDQDMNVTAAFFFAIQAIIVITCSCVFGLIKLKEYKERKYFENYGTLSEKEPSKLKVFYRNWKDKTCEKITFED